jgi:hypothetical protein
LLLSANLAPSDDYAAGVRRVLPLYDNAPTRDWLLSFLRDLGLGRRDGTLIFSIEQEPTHGLLRIVAHYRFKRDSAVSVHGHEIQFCRGQSLRVFFSYRHRPELMPGLFEPYGLHLMEQFISTSGEEGVFLVRRASRRETQQ